MGRPEAYGIGTLKDMIEAHDPPFRKLIGLMTVYQAHRAICEKFGMPVDHRRTPHDLVMALAGRGIPIPPVRLY